MIGFATKIFRAVRICRSVPMVRPSPPVPPPPVPPLGFRLFSRSGKRENSFIVNPVTQQMIDYAFSVARSQKSDESYSQSLLVLEQCHSTQADENSRGIVLLAMASILYERGDFAGAIEKLQSIENLGLSSLAIRAESFFLMARDDEGCTGNAALSYGEYVHGVRKLPLAQELYQNVIQQLSAEDLNNLQDFGACNMAKDEVLLAATCALGQLEACLGNFGNSEEILTRALKKAEEHFGSNHPKVAVILTCIALMFRLKAAVEGSSSLLVQEGLYRKAIELLKAPSLEIEGAEVMGYRREIIALARGGYADILCLQQNRKAEGERMRQWAEAAWKNRRLSLAEALDTSQDSPKLPVIDTRICRSI